MLKKYMLKIYAHRIEVPLKFCDHCLVVQLVNCLHHLKFDFRLTSL